MLNLRLTPHCQSFVTSMENQRSVSNVQFQVGQAVSVHTARLSRNSPRASRVQGGSDLTQHQTRSAGCHCTGNSVETLSENHSRGLTWKWHRLPKKMALISHSSTNTASAMKILHLIQILIVTGTNTASAMKIFYLIQIVIVPGTRHCQNWKVNS